METKRDISIVTIDKNRSLVIACDVSGGIGPKSGDSLKVSGEVVGFFTTRVALMEALSVGAEPISIVDTLSVEYDPSGKNIIKGITKAVKEIGLDPGRVINGSTEDNINTFETGVGVTVVAITDNDSLKINNSKNGNILALIGMPLVGKEVLEKKDKIVDFSDLKILLEKNYINEILTVGSKGIKYEAELLASMSSLKVEYNDSINIDLEKSAGPASAILISLSENKVMNLKNDFAHRPINIIGKLV